MKCDECKETREREAEKKSRDRTGQAQPRGTPMFERNDKLRRMLQRGVWAFAGGVGVAVVSPTLLLLCSPASDGLVTTYWSVRDDGTALCVDSWTRHLYGLEWLTTMRTTFIEAESWSVREFDQETYYAFEESQVLLEPAKFQAARSAVPPPDSLYFGEPGPRGFDVTYVSGWPFGSFGGFEASLEDGRKKAWFWMPPREDFHFGNSCIPLRPLFPNIALNALIFALGILAARPAIRLPIAARARLRRLQGRCPSCGYRLIVPSTTCPECGVHEASARGQR